MLFLRCALRIKSNRRIFQVTNGSDLNDLLYNSFSIYKPKFSRNLFISSAMLYDF